MDCYDIFVMIVMILNVTKLNSDLKAGVIEISLFFKQEATKLFFNFRSHPPIPKFKMFCLKVSYCWLHILNIGMFFQKWLFLVLTLKRLGELNLTPPCCFSKNVSSKGRIRPCFFSWRFHWNFTSRSEVMKNFTVTIC